jgi:hypothetical protein
MILADTNALSATMHAAIEPAVEGLVFRPRQMISSFVCSRAWPWSFSPRT